MVRGISGSGDELDSVKVYYGRMEGWLNGDGLGGILYRIHDIIC